MKKILVLRTNDEKNCGHGGFKWPRKGAVKCPDWDPKPECGNGLHGLAKGEGDANLLTHTQGDNWCVVEVNEKDIVNLSGKVKFPSGKVLFTGAKDKAIKLIQDRHHEAACVFGTATAGDSGTATAGDSGTATAGAQGTATAGNYGTATAGNYGTATAGNYGTATAGDSGTATAGAQGTATAGNYGTATAGDSGTATAGDSGTATAGNSGTATAGAQGTATAGNYGTATAGDSGTATAGDSGTATAGAQGTATAGNYGTATAGDSGTATAGDLAEIRIRFWDGNRYRTKVGWIGEDGLKANTPYVLNDKHEFQEKASEK